MDSLDQKILLELMQNSRIPITQLAKKLKRSREVINYRISQLIKDKIILNFVTEINIENLGFTGAAVFIKIRERRIKEFKDYLDKCKFVSWMSELSGVWNFGLSIYGKNNNEIDERFLEFYNIFKEDIIDHRFVLHKKSNFFYEKYFRTQNPKSIKRINKEVKLDNKDKAILKNLMNNSRLDSVTLSKLIGLTPQSIAQRIKNLEKSNIIEKYSLFIDISKINLLQYSIFIENNNTLERKKLIQYLTLHQNISFIAEYIGDPFLEFGVAINNPYLLRPILQEIEQSFPENKIIEVSLFQKEFISIGPPLCVFE
nr:hypothetical protein [Nanoarchaeum sp.]